MNNKCINRRYIQQIVDVGDYCEIIVNSRKYGELRVKIDRDDKEKVSNHNWCVKTLTNSTAKYIQTNIKINGKYRSVALHRFILSAVSVDVDHINRDPFDNRKSNLRQVTKSINIHNRTMTKSIGKSRVFRNIYKARNGVQVSIQINKRHIKKGFESVHEALAFRNQKIVELYGADALRYVLEEDKQYDITFPEER